MEEREVELTLVGDGTRVCRATGFDCARDCQDTTSESLQPEKCYDPLAIEGSGHIPYVPSNPITPVAWYREAEEACFLCFRVAMYVMRHKVLRKGFVFSHVKQSISYQINVDGRRTRKYKDKWRGEIGMR